MTSQKVFFTTEIAETGGLGGESVIDSSPLFHLTKDKKTGNQIVGRKARSGCCRL
jgi:hypothetical protein